MSLFVPLNSSTAFKRSDKMHVHASRVSTSDRAVFSHPISLPLANQALHSPSPFCLIVHPFRIHPYCIYLVRLFRVHSYRTCVVGLFRTRFLRALSHANFRNARPIELSQRLPNELFCAHFHSTLGLSRSLCKSFHRNLSILALMPSSHSSWLRTRAQPGWWHPSPHLEYSSFTRR